MLSAVRRRHRAVDHAHSKLEKIDKFISNLTKVISCPKDKEKCCARVSVAITAVDVPDALVLICVLLMVSAGRCRYNRKVDPINVVSGFNVSESCCACQLLVLQQICTVRAVSSLGVLLEVSLSATMLGRFIILSAVNLPWLPGRCCTGSESCW